MEYPFRSIDVHARLIAFDEEPKTKRKPILSQAFPH
jgi:hypothetical protein